jgi:pyruvate dehydrogenase E1 component alpha subunit
MITEHTVESLQAFEHEIAELFNAGQIRAPIHLAGGNERQLLDIFSKVNEADWVCGTWRSHLHCLLKGVTPAVLKQAILDKRSITLAFPEQRVITSAIVGGIIPIATGIALGNKLRGSTNHVWCFIGDMASCTGAFHENQMYARGWDLPITYVIEDNNISVCTPSRKVWGDGIAEKNGFVIGYGYVLKYPHAGAGKRVEF